MKQRLNKLLAIALTASLCMPMLPAGTARAAENGVTFTDEQTIMVSHYGEERATSFNDGWKFNLGRSDSAKNPDFNDSSWEDVDLPHDFSISQDFTLSGEAESGFLPGGTGWYRKSFVLPESCNGKRLVLNFDGVYSIANVYVNGTKVGEHRYGYTPFAFDITDYVKCDSATQNVVAVEAVNNIPSSRWYSGSGIYRDVTLLVTEPVHVALNGTYVTTPNLKDTNGTDGTVNMAVEVQNESESAANVTVRNTVYEKDGKQAASPVEETASVGAGAAVTVNATAKVDSPKLWSIDDPNLYVVRTEVLVNGKTVDTYDTEFGFKWYEFVADTGFKLNGENVKINGVCMHNDQGALGSAAYYDAMYRQLMKMKDMGVNTIRITHNPGDEDFVNICNEIGLLVIEEIFDGWHFPKNGNSNDFATYFKKNLSADNQVIGGSSTMTWAEFVMKSTIKRDRNDASVILWSLGNEIQEGASGNNGWGPIARNMIRWAEEVDTEHLLTSGSNNRSVSTDDNNSACVNKILYDKGGVAGFNYGNERDLNNLHGTYSVFLASETASAVNSRGVYTANSTGEGAIGGHLTSYDESCVGWGKTAHASMWDTLRFDYVAGECVWTGFDYIGEPTPWNGTGTGGHSAAPVRGVAAPNSSYFGIVETTGFEKDNYYLYRSQWNKDENTLHLVTAWDSDNMKTTGGKTPVWVYSNAAKVELYRDNQKIGTATGTVNRTDAGHTYTTYTTESNAPSICTTSSGNGSESLYAVFHVAYTEGTLYAKAYDAEGNDITDTCSGKTTVTTPGAASKLKLSQDKTEIAADGSSLVYISVDVTDEAGNEDTAANHDITFTLEGDGEIQGVDNGDQATVDKYQQESVLTSEKSAHIRAYAGKALVIVKSTSNAGSFTVEASAEGLTGGSVSVTTKAAEGQVTNGIVSYQMTQHCYVPVGTAAGAFSLPSRVPVTLADGSKKNVNVAWEAYDSAKLKEAGTIVVKGAITNGADQVAVSFTIHVYDAIAGAKNYSGITSESVMPVLPGTLMTYYADGTAFEEFPVDWDRAELTNESFAKVGDIVEINGTLSAFGKSYPVKASIRVAEAKEAGTENIALSASQLLQSCNPTSDDLNSIKDGIKYSDPNGTSGRWTDYHDATGTTPTITMKWDTVHLIEEIRLFYYTDRNVAEPKTVTFKTSGDGESFTEIGYAEPVEIPAVDSTDPQKKAVKGYIYKLNNVVNPIAIQIILERNGKCVGLTEAEVISRNYIYESNTSASLDSIKVNGQEIAGFKPEMTEYVVDSLGDVTVMNSMNASVTVLKDGEDAITILSVSEDGKTTAKYTISRKTSEKERADASAKLAELKKLDSSLYTAESYAKLQSAIAALETNLATASAKQLKDLLGEIAKAQEGLKETSKPILTPTPIPTPTPTPTPTPIPTPTPAIKAGDKATANKMEFKVLDAKAKTVALTQGKNKKAATVKIPDTVKVNGETCKVVQIGKNAFKGYARLKSVTIGKNVATIESKAFYGCKKLSKVTFKGTAVKKIKSGAFKKTSSRMTVKVPKSLKKNKKAFAKFKKSLTKAGISKKAKIK